MPIAGALLLSGAITIFIVYMIISTFASAWPAEAGEESAQIFNKGKSALLTFDYMFLYYIFGLSAFCIISAFFIESNPVFFVFSAILTAINIFISSIYVNVFDVFAHTDAFIGVANQFPFITSIMYNLPLFSLCLSLLIAIVIHGKPGGGGI